MKNLTECASTVVASRPRERVAPSMCVTDVTSPDAPASFNWHRRDQHCCKVRFHAWKATSREAPEALTPQAAGCPDLLHPLSAVSEKELA